jgi:predicted NBD/HSP70 family sugar kinase
VDDLINRGWLHVSGRAEANHGRPAMLFGLSDAPYIVIGAQIRLPGIHMIVADLTGQVLDVYDSDPNSVPTPSVAIQAIAEYALQVRSSFPRSILLGVGIAAPGFIDPVSGDIIEVKRVSGWSLTPFASTLRSQCNLAVQVANDIDSMAQVEYREYADEQNAYLAFVGLDQGLKVSVMVEGALYRGAFGNAGLVDPTLLNTQTSLTPRDLKRILSLQGMREILAERLTEAATDGGAEVRAVLAKHEGWSWLAALYDVRHIHPAVETLLADVQAVLSAAAVNIIYTLQPHRLILGGALAHLPPEIFDALRETIYQRLPHLFREGVALSLAANADQHGAALGATFHLVQSLFTDSTYDPLSPVKVPFPEVP